MKETGDFWDRCITALPPEKWPGAKLIVEEFSRGDPNGASTKLFLLFEAHVAQTDATREQMAGLLATERENAGKAVDAIGSKVDNLATEVKTLNGQVLHLRLVRVGGVLLLMCASAILSGWLVSGRMRHVGGNGVLLEKERVNGDGLSLNVLLEEKKIKVFVNGQVLHILRMTNGVGGVAVDVLEK